MPGSVTLSSDEVPLARPAAQILVYLETPDADPPFRLLPNIRALSVHEQEGAHPSVARFRYAFGDPFNDEDDPSRVEEVWGFDVSGPHVVTTDAHVSIYAQFSEQEDDYDVLFDGYVSLPQLDLAGETEMVGFEAFGTPIRMWDNIIRGAVYRDGDNPNDANAQEVITGLPVRFNPEGEPNATPATFDVSEGDPDAHPDFYDHLITRDPDVRRHWTLGMAVRYLLNVHNPLEKYVENPPADEVDAILESYEPTSDDGPIDPDDESTYTKKPIIVQDIDVRGDVLPVALAKILEPHGFSFCFRLSMDDNGDPKWRIQFYRKDVQKPEKWFKLQKAGEDYDPRKTDIASLSLQRDGELVNGFVGLTALKRYEGSFVLAPLFTPATADNSSVGSAANFNKRSPHFIPVKYRDFGVDETGEGHWEQSSSTFVTDQACNFDKILGTPEDNGGDPNYVYRRRPGRAHLLSKYAPGEESPCELYISTDYAGDACGVWDGSGTWQKVASSAWELLPDRLGIRLTMDDPQAWNIGAPPAGETPVVPGDVVNVIACIGDPTSSPDVYFYLRLVTVIDGDVGMEEKAEPRLASPTKFKIYRADELGDRFRIDVVHESSPESDGITENLRDDTDDLKAHLTARRKAHELAVIAGPAMIPRITKAFQVGDRIKEVRGRGIDLAMNWRQDPQDAAVYPCVVGRTFTFGDRQETTFQLSDRRADPPPEKMKHRDEKIK